jgi:hypothetical protein
MNRKRNVDYRKAAPPLAAGVVTFHLSSSVDRP